MDKTKASNGFFWSCFSFSLFMVIRLFAVRFIYENKKWHYSVVMISLLILTFVFTAVAKVFLKDGRTVSDYLHIHTPGFLTMILGVFASLLFIPGTSVLILINNYLVEFISGRDISALDASVYLESGLLSSLLIMALLPCICEELFFRGFILGATSGYSAKSAVIFNGLLFALAHINFGLSRILDAFIMGIVFSYAVLKTKSIFPSIIMHFVYNASGILLLFLPYYIDSDSFENLLYQLKISAGQGMLDMLIYILIFTFIILVFMAGLFLLSKMRCRKDYKRKLFGLEPEPEMPKRKDSIPIPLQMLFILPGIFCYVIFRIFLFFDIPVPAFIRMLTG